MSTLAIESKNLHQPTLEDLAQVLGEGLRKNFQNVEVSVVDCPKLNEEPFHLVCEGLSGDTSILDIGGVPNLLPFAQVNKPQYRFKDILRLVNLSNGMVVGAGAGPHHNVGTNCEMTANIGINDGKLLNETRICKIMEKGYSLQKLDVAEFALLGNFYCSEGKPGKVLEVKASVRKGPDSYTSCIRKNLANHYKDKAVGLGGVFLIEKGKAKLHVMPKFSSTPLETDEDLNKWLQFFEMNSPLICLGELVSHDPGLDLRVEHFHCFSSHGDGGHYHYDTTPDDVVYRGYFNVAQKIHRIDRPKETHNIGRD